MRVPMFQRAGAPAPSEQAHEQAEGPVVEAMEEQGEQDGIECPACGMRLVDSPEARAYVAARGQDLAADGGDDDESGED